MGAEASVASRSAMVCFFRSTRTHPHGARGGERWPSANCVCDAFAHPLGFLSYCRWSARLPHDDSCRILSICLVNQRCDFVERVRKQSDWKAYPFRHPSVNARGKRGGVSADSHRARPRGGGGGGGEELFKHGGVLHSPDCRGL